MSSVIVYGPQGCGKSRNKQLLMNHFGLDKVIDDYVPGDKLQNQTLHLTSTPCDGALDYYDVVKGS